MRTHGSPQLPYRDPSLCISRAPESRFSRFVNPPETEVARGFPAFSPRNS
jgi:hypothetical protein